MCFAPRLASPTVWILLVVLSSSTLNAQTGSTPVGVGHAYTLTIPGVTATVGSAVEIPIYLVSDQPLTMIVFFAEVDPTLLEITNIVPGAAMEEYTLAFGPPPTCDIIIYPDATGAMVVMAFAEPFDSGSVGAEFVVVKCEVNATVPTATTMTTMTDLGDVIETPVAIVEDWPFQRGDVNADSICDITDAIAIMEQLFRSAPTSCPDASDIDDNGGTEITDAVLLLTSLFMEGPALDETCAHDSTSDALAGCDDSACP